MDPTLLKKAEKSYGSGRMPVAEVFCHHGTSNFKRFIYVAQNLKCFATIVNMSTILMCISCMKVMLSEVHKLS